MLLASHVGLDGLCSSSNKVVSAMLQPAKDADTISYLSQAEATAIDEVLMGELGFSIDQLMVKALTVSQQFLAFVGPFVTCIRTCE